MAPVTYIASNENSNSFFLDSFTYIASNAEYFFEALKTETKAQVMQKLCEEVPAEIFLSDLSALEAVTKYLKDTKSLRLCEIASILNRDDRTIWNAYNEACKKNSTEFLSKESENGPTISENQLMIPLSIFSDRKLSMLEAVTCYLKEDCGKRNCDIAYLIGKDARTIWTVYNRAQKKRRATAQ